MRSPDNAPDDSRLGLSLVDAAVVLFVLLLLFALILPGMHQGVNRGRRSECMIRMQQLTLAVTAYTSTHQGNLPSLSDGTGSWLVTLLPYLDQAAVSEKWDPAIDTRPGGLGSTFMPIFVCPDDPDRSGVPGGLSYVANAGYGDFPIDPRTGHVTDHRSHSGLNIDWDGNGQTGSEADLKIAISTGLFWFPNPQQVRTNVGRIRDGLSQTLIFSESLNAGAAGNWGVRSLFNHAFVVDAAVSHDNQPRNFGTRLGPLAVTKKAKLDNFAMNSDKGTRRGHWPSPSSVHPGGVNFFFADGSGRAISEKIDIRVYVRLLSPQGSLHGQQIVESTEFR